MPTFDVWEIPDEDIGEYNKRKREKKYEIEINQRLVEFILWCLEFTIEKLDEIDKIEDAIDMKNEFLDLLK